MGPTARDSCAHGAQAVAIVKAPIISKVFRWDQIYFSPATRRALGSHSTLLSFSCAPLTQSTHSIATPQGPKRMHHALPVAPPLRSNHLASRKFDVHSSTTTPLLLHQTRGRFIPHVRSTNRRIRRDGMSHCSKCRNTGFLVSSLSDHAALGPCHFSSRYMVICKRVGRS